MVTGWFTLFCYLRRQLWILAKGWRIFCPYPGREPWRSVPSSNSKHNLFDLNKRKCRGNIIEPKKKLNPLCRELAKVEIDDTDITLQQFILDVFKHCNITDNFFRDTSGKKLKLKNIKAQTCQISQINLTEYFWFSQAQYLSKRNLV